MNTTPVEIELSAIKPNPANRLVTEEMIGDMAKSLTELGLLNPIKLFPISSDNYEVFSGHIRLAGAAKLGWKTIRAIVTDKTREEAVLEGIWDNRQQSQTWLDDYRDIEALEAANPNITNDQLAKKLDMNLNSIKRGKRILKCLNSACRELINQNLKKSLISSGRVPATSSKDWTITESSVYRLTNLEDPDQVFEALQAVIDHQLIETQTQDLVQSIQAGNPADGYTPAQTAPKAKKAPAAPAAQTTPAIHSTAAQTTDAGKKPESESFKTYWEELKTDCRGIFGTEPTWHPYAMFTLIIGLMVGLGWGALSLIGWLLSLIPRA